jgi:Na+/melibiose symporter-like transporter
MTLSFPSAGKSKNEVLAIMRGALSARFYPLTRDRHARIRSMLERKKERATAREIV